MSKTFTKISGQFLAQLVPIKPVVDQSCYIPTDDEKKTFSFKARLDVHKHIGGLLEKVVVSIKGKEIATNIHKTPLFSSVSSSLGEFVFQEVSSSR